MFLGLSDPDLLVSDTNPDADPSSVADPDPGSGAFLTPGSGIRDRFFPDPGFWISDPGTIFLRAF
jgi:hypothetical protein